MHSQKDIMDSLWILVIVFPTVIGQYKVNVDGCTKDMDCDTANGQICYRKYSGCDRGECMCPPSTHHYHQGLEMCVKVLRYNDRCGQPGLECPDRMVCREERCRCDYGSPTDDGEYCKKGSERVLGESCTGGRSPDSDKCIKKRVDFGYTTEDVACNYGHCICRSGLKAYRNRCRKYSLGESGCRQDYHCEGGALCQENVCRCPKGMKPIHNYRRCAKQDAILELTFNHQCDEAGGSSYCSYGLICQKCPGEKQSKCVKLLRSTSSHTAAAFSTSLTVTVLALLSRIAS